MSLSTFLNKIFPKVENTFTGLILPPQKEINSITTFNEIVASASPVVWKTLNVDLIPSWPQYNQGYTSSCVAHTKALMDSILYFLRTGSKIKFSPVWIYDHRTNKPSAGMIGTNAFAIGRDVGSIPYDLLNTPQSEIEANKPIVYPWFDDIGKVFRTADEPILVPIKNIDTLVSIQQATGKPIMVWFEFEWSEWAKFVPTINVSAPTLRHSVTFIPPSNLTEMTYGMLNGEKAIIIQDSAGVNSTQNGNRIITESFFKERNIFAAYTMRFKFDVTMATPHYDGTIISLQKCLMSLGYFPSNITPIESYGNITRGAVIKFQQANGLTGTGLLDEATKSLLQAKFN